MSGDRVTPMSRPVGPPPPPIPPLLSDIIQQGTQGASFQLGFDVIEARNDEIVTAILGALPDSAQERCRTALDELVVDVGDVWGSDFEVKNTPLVADWAATARWLVKLMPGDDDRLSQFLSAAVRKWRGLVPAFSGIRRRERDRCAILAWTHFVRALLFVIAGHVRHHSR